MRLVVGFAFALLVAAPAAAQEVEIDLGEGETLLQVEAEGVQRSRPDLMTISAGVATTGRTAAEALAANNALAERLIARVRGLGVSPQDLRTRELSIQPRFDESRRGMGEEPRITGYVANNVVEMRLRDLGRAGAIIGEAFEAGANRVEGPTFSLANNRPARLAAQREGVRLAREEAENYAEALGMRVVRVLRVSERGGDARREDNAIVVTGSRIMRVPVEPGEVETQTRVWVDFALAPR